MELYDANRILRSVKSALAADGFKLPSSAETDGLLMLLDRIDIEKYLAPKVKHARAASPGSTAFERSNKLFSFFRALRAAAEPTLSDPVTTLQVTILHKSLFGDIDPEAGKPRTKDAYTDGNAHTDPKYINGSLKSIVTKMNEIGSAPETSKDDFAGYLSHYMRELIILHPFDRGCEFTLRIFIMLFCKLKGFSLCYYRATAESIRDAEKAVIFDDDVAPLFRLLTLCLSYDHKTVLPDRPTSPQTRREAESDLRRPQRVAAKREKALTEGKPPEKNAIKDDDVLKRAIRLQQKISRLNEQLTELMTMEKTDRKPDDK